jgi:thiamine biosynthesis lipoprotein
MGISTADTRIAPGACGASRLRVAMGTFVALEAEASSPSCADEAITGAWEAILTVQRVMHPRHAGSDLAILAGCAPGATVQVHPWTWDVLRICGELFAATGGAFDPCPGAKSGGLPGLELLASCRVLAQRATQLDLGGIAKGYAVDRALEAIRSAGCSAGLVNAGGDLAVFGVRSRTIRIGTAAAGRDFELQDAALASSDTAGAGRPPEHRGYYHGRDRNRKVCGQASVTAPRAVWADALTKCALLLSAGPLEQLLRRFDARVVASAGVACPP